MRLFRAESSKAMRNPWFAVALLTGIALCIADFASAINEDVIGGLAPAETTSCFSEWISVRYYTPFAILFYRLAPLLAVVPYSWSLAQERGSGYVAQLYTRASRVRCLVSKIGAAFLAGGIVVVAPQLLNLALFATVFPASLPDVFEAIYIGIFDDNLWADYFYSVPFVYVLLYCTLDFVLCGLWASFVLMIGAACANRVVILAAPYLALVLLQFVNERIFLALGGIRGVQLSLFENLHAYSVQYVQSGWIIAAEAALLAVGIVFLMLLGTGRAER